MPSEVVDVDHETRQALEAILFVVDEPIEVGALAEVLEQPREVVHAALERLAQEYRDSGRGLVIREVAGGWRMYTAPAAYPYLERFVLSGRSGRLTQAALETLAVIAYKQPISRQQVSDIRGVNAEGAIKSLAQRGFVEEVGRDEGPGQAILYGTTAQFLEQLGLGSLAELPALTDFLPEEGAPDEPPLDEFRSVRKRLAAGGRIGMDQDEDEEGAEGDPSTNAVGVAAGEGRQARRSQEREMEELTSSLERAARAAVGELRRAMEATEEEGEEDTGAPADTGGAEDERS